MIALESKLTGTELYFNDVKDRLEPLGFSLGGNWEYTGGSFDLPLDGEERKVWLRIPFATVYGRIDPDSPLPNTRVAIDSPYVLKHVYREGNDPSANMNLAGALFDQFQQVEDADAKVPDRFVREAEVMLRKVEALF